MTPEKMSLVADFINGLAQKAFLDQQINDTYNKLSDDRVLLDFLTDFALKTNENIEVKKSAPPQTPPVVPTQFKIEEPYVVVDPLPPTPIEYAQKLFSEEETTEDYNPTIDETAQEGLPTVNWGEAVDSVVQHYEKPEVWGFNDVSRSGNQDTTTNDKQLEDESTQSASTDGDEERVSEG